MNLHKYAGNTGSNLAIKMDSDRMMVSESVFHLLVLAEDQAEVDLIMKNLDIIDIEKLKIPAFTIKNRRYLP
jgi:hypothetical protein